MINARRHTEKLFIYTVLYNILEGCYADNPEKDKGKLEAELLEIKAAERDPKKSDKNVIRAIKLAQHLMKNNENSLKILLATRYLLQDLIDSGFELFDEEDYGYQLFCELLEVIDPEECIQFDKKERKAVKMAQEWLEYLNKEGYFL